MSCKVESRPNQSHNMQFMTQVRDALCHAHNVISATHPTCRKHKPSWLGMQRCRILHCKHTKRHFLSAAEVTRITCHTTAEPHTGRIHGGKHCMHAAKQLSTACLHHNASSK
jgi:hypothetical protein